MVTEVATVVARAWICIQLIQTVEKAQVLEIFFNALALYVALLSCLSEEPEGDVPDMGLRDSHDV